MKTNHALPVPVRHPLRRWRTERELTLQGLAARIKKMTGKTVGQPHLSLIERGQKMPSPALANCISMATGGEVTLNDLFEYVPHRRAAHATPRQRRAAA